MALAFDSLASICYTTTNGHKLDMKEFLEELIYSPGSGYHNLAIVELQVPFISELGEHFLKALNEKKERLIDEKNWIKFVHQKNR